jgi:hypothetical protein
MLFTSNKLQRIHETDERVGRIIGGMSPVNIKVKFLFFLYYPIYFEIISLDFPYFFQYDCFYAPFEFNSITYVWWNDRDGNDKYFWAGSNVGGLPRKHFCQCGIDGNCVDNSLKCNCDASAPVQLVDDGKFWHYILSIMAIFFMSQN